MSNENGNKPHDLDPAKQFPFYPPEYWMITEGWTEVIEESKVEIGSQGRTLTSTRQSTRAICVHPLAHYAAGRTHGLRNYAILNSVPITKKLYDWWIDITVPQAAQQATEITEKVLEEKNAETKLS